MAEKLSAEEAARIKEPPRAEDGAGGLPPEQGLEIFGSTVLGAEPETLTVKYYETPKDVREVDITIGPMIMDQVADFLVIAEKFLPALGLQAKGATDTHVDFNLTALMRIDKEAFFKAISIAGNIDVQILKKLLPDDFLKVCTKVFVVNLDFFVRTLPHALGMAEASIIIALQNMLGQAGALLSKDSSKKVIA